jgi:predicted esterase
MVEPWSRRGKRRVFLRTDGPNLRGATQVTLSREYTLTLPAGAPPAGRWPVLLGLHGFGESGERLAARLAGLEGAPYARLYPDGPFPIEMREPEGSRIGATWYQYTGDQEAFLRALAFAEGYLRDLLTAVARKHPVDPGRVVLLGYSQGGYLAGVAAFRDRDRYRGLVGIACRIKTEALERELASARGYPVLLIHGARDQHTAADRQKEAHEELLRHGVESELHVHDGGHGLRTETVPMIDAFVRKALGA